MSSRQTDQNAADTQPPFRLPGVSIAPRPARPLREPLPPTAEMTRLGLALRPETPDDIGLLHAIYTETRAAEMLMLGNSWDRDTKRHFVDTQFAYQYVHHARHYADGDFAIVTLRGEPVGRFYLYWGARDRDCQLVEVQLIERVRDRGIGSTLLGALLRHAQTLRYSVSLYVERMSPARRLYARFGFQPVGTELHNGSMMMQWRDGPVVPGLRLAE